MVRIRYTLFILSCSYLTDVMMRQKTPLMNRVMFGIISFLFISGFLEMVYHYTSFRGALPYAIWITLFGLAIVGFALTTANGDIKLRLHKIWTPIGFLLIACAVLSVIFVDMPRSNGLVDAVLNNSTEAIPYVIGFGLSLAFVDTEVFYKYAYYFGVLTLLNILLIPVYAVAYIPNLISGAHVDFEVSIDVLWFLSGPIFAYYIAKKLKADRPTRREIYLAIGKFVAATILLIIVGFIVGKMLPANSWPSHWLSTMNQFHPQS